MRSIIGVLRSAFIVLLGLPSISASERCASIPPSLWCSSTKISKECGFEEHCNRYTKTVYNQRINMTILGEALCIDCMNYYSNQLYPVIFKNFNEFVNINYVPYGNVRIVNGSMVCQHGFMECFINRYQSCMIHVLRKQEDYLPLLYCLEDRLKRRLPFNHALWSCYDKYPIPAGTKGLIQCDNVPLCTSLDLSHRLCYFQRSYDDSAPVLIKGRNIHRIYFGYSSSDILYSVWPDVKKSVPWFVFNGVSLKSIQEKIDLIPKLLCDWYQGNKKIPYCETNAATISHCDKEL